MTRADLAAATLSGPALAALVPFLVVAIAFAVFCVVDVVRAEAVRYLPKWLWIVICLISVPLGGIVYLIVGRSR